MLALELFLLGELVIYFTVFIVCLAQKTLGRLHIEIINAAVK